MKAVYVRISTANQNLERQLKKDKSIKPYIDICSGSVLFNKRPGAIAMMKNKKITEIQVKEISRLGRNLKDILNTIEYFKENKINLKIENLGFSLFIDGKENPIALLIVSMFGAISEHERNMINERTQEGRNIAKAKGKFKGRKRGATSDLMLKNEMLITAMQSKLNEGWNISRISDFYHVSRPRIYSYLKKGLIARSDN